MVGKFMSSSRILQSMTPVIKNPNLKIIFKISDKLPKEIGKINGIPVFENQAAVSLDQLSDLLDQINSLLTDTKLSDKNRVLLEAYKLAVYKSVLSHLKHLPTQGIKKDKDKIVTKKPSRLLRYLKMGFLGLMTIVGMAEDSIMVFVGMREMIVAIIPTIASAWLIVIPLVFVAISMIQFFGFEVGMLKEALGIKNRNTAKLLIETHEKQIDATHELNNRLVNVSIITHLDKLDYSAFMNIGVKANEDVQNKKTSVYTEYKEHPAKKALRVFLTVFGGVLVVAGSYFGAISLLGVVGATLIGTPAGWAIIGVLVASALVFYLAMQNKSVKAMLNPALALFDKVKERLLTFKIKEKLDFEKVLKLPKVLGQYASNITTGLDLANEQEPSVNDARPRMVRK